MNALLRTEARLALESGKAQELRRAARLTLREIAGEIGVTPVAVLRWDSGERVPRGERAERYGAFLRELERVVSG